MCGKNRVLQEHDYTTAGSDWKTAAIAATHQGVSSNLRCQTVDITLSNMCYAGLPLEDVESGSVEKVKLSSE